MLGSDNTVKDSVQTLSIQSDNTNNNMGRISDLAALFEPVVKHFIPFHYYRRNDLRIPLEGLISYLSSLSSTKIDKALSLEIKSLLEQYHRSIYSQEEPGLQLSLLVLSDKFSPDKISTPLLARTLRTLHLFRGMLDYHAERLRDKYQFSKDEMHQLVWGNQAFISLINQIPENRLKKLSMKGVTINHSREFWTGKLLSSATGAEVVSEEKLKHIKSALQKFQNIGVDLNRNSALGNESHGFHVANLKIFDVLCDLGLDVTVKNDKDQTVLSRIEKVNQSIINVYQKTLDLVSNHFDPDDIQPIEIDQINADLIEITDNQPFKSIIEFCDFLQKVEERLGRHLQYVEYADIDFTLSEFILFLEGKSRWPQADLE